MEKFNKISEEDFLELIVPNLDWNDKLTIWVFDIDHPYHKESISGTLSNEFLASSFKIEDDVYLYINGKNWIWWSTKDLGWDKFIDILNSYPKKWFFN